MRKVYDKLTKKKKPTIHDLKIATDLFYDSDDHSALGLPQSYCVEQLHQCAMLHYLQSLLSFLNEHEMLHGFYEIEVIEELIEITLKRQEGQRQDFTHVSLRRHTYEMKDHPPYK